MCWCRCPPRVQEATASRIFGPDGYAAGAGNPYDPQHPFVAGVADVIWRLYPPTEPDSRWQLIYNISDIFGTCPAREVARGLAATGQPVYRYLFTHRFEDSAALFDILDPTLPLSIFRAYHGAELPFVFASLGDIRGNAYRATPAERALSDSLIGYWTRFAGTRNPNGAGAATWIPTGVSGEQIMLLDDARDDELVSARGVRLHAHVLSAAMSEKQRSCPLLSKLQQRAR